MNDSEVIEMAHQQFTNLGKQPAGEVTALSRTEDGWSIMLEALERKAVSDTLDVLGLYELRLDNYGNLLGLHRRRLRQRGEKVDN
jgi:hypothetical protein